MLTKQQRQQLKSLIQSGYWQTVEDFKTQYINSISSRSVVRDTEWETLKEALINEGQARGITNFINQLIEEASRNE